LPQPAALSASDEERFATPDALSAGEVTDAVTVLRKCYFGCKKQRLGPECKGWSVFTATWVRSWIARIQSDPNHPDLLDRKALFVLWWNRDAALKEYAAGTQLTHPKRLKGIHADAEVLEQHLWGIRSLKAPQEEWVEKAYNTLVPLVKRQILQIIPKDLA
jgi:hypothetical protein